MKRAKNHSYHMCPGDYALTPSGRLVLIEEVLPNGRRRCTYLDAEGGEVELRPSLLRLTVSRHVRSTA